MFSTEMIPVDYLVNMSGDYIIIDGVSLIQNVNGYVE